MSTGFTCFQKEAFLIIRQILMGRTILLAILIKLKTLLPQNFGKFTHLKEFVSIKTF